MIHTKHLWRAFIILIGLVLIVFTGRHFLIPESFGVQGHFRFNNIKEFRSQPMRHMTDASCRKCHKENYKTHLQGKHKSVPCENCHGPYAFHTDGQEKIADALVQKSWELCALCHQPLESRPKDFPQVDFKEHMNELLVQEGLKPKERVPQKICFLCHDPHDPGKE